MGMAMKVSLCAFVLAPVAIAQPVQWRVQDGGNGHWYEGVTFGAPATHDSARSWATSRGAHLVTITSQGECDFVNALADRDSLWENYWVGPIIGITVDGSGCMAGCWDTGEPITYTNWHPGNPDFPATDNCVFLFERCCKRWQNYPCDAMVWLGAYPHSAIIEWADCNGDGIDDELQFASGQLFDANHNGVADTCGIAVQPVDQSVSVNVPVAFFVEITPAPACPAPVAFRWQRRDPSVHDANAPNAWLDIADTGAFLNSGTAGLLITHPIPGLATGYRCKLTGGCGCETTYTNVVNFSVACPADFNADGAVDFFDYDDFVRAFEAGC